MKKKFSTAWKGSKQPRKQRKYLAKAPLHIKRKLLSVNLSKDLRKKVGKRNVVVRKGDNVKVMTGKFKGKTGKIIQVFTKKSKVTMEGIQVKKQDGSKANIKLQPSNLQIIELNLDDKKRISNKKTENKENKK
jgi:large subunit ribosomal protein L24